MSADEAKKPETKKPEKRFRVKIALEIEDEASGYPVFSATNQYRDMPYDGVVTVEQVMQDAMQRLINVGYAKANEMGLGEKLKQIAAAGIAPPGAVVPVKK